MTMGTYGLAKATQGTMRLGAGLPGLANAEEAEATAMARNAAQAEAQRNLENKQLERDKKAGNAQLGSTVGSLAGMAIGAQYGSAGGPWGAAIGAVIGGLAGGAF